MAYIGAAWRQLANGGGAGGLAANEEENAENRSGSASKRAKGEGMKRMAANEASSA